MKLAPTVARGASAKIERVIPQLCQFTGSPYPSFMSAWVALTSNSPLDPFGDNIYQIGYIKCSTSGTGCPTNTHSYVWAYGHEQTQACGARKSPSAQFIGPSAVGTKTYEVYRHSSESGFEYSVYIDGVEKNTQSQSNLETCWIGGPKNAKYQDETGNRNDQVGGTTANPQDWTVVSYLDGASWILMNASGNCTVHQNGSNCTASGSTFKVWDPRL